MDGTAGLPPDVILVLALLGAILTGLSPIAVAYINRGGKAQPAAADPPAPDINLVALQDEENARLGAELDRRDREVERLADEVDRKDREASRLRDQLTRERLEHARDLQAREGP